MASLKKKSSIKKLCKNKPQLATTCRATCNMCGVTPTSRWEKVGQNIDGVNIGDYSGFSVSLSGDGKTVAIGATENDNNDSDKSGYAHIFKNVSGVWSRVGEIIYSENIGDGKGHSVSLSDDGNTVAIGAKGNDDGGAYSGQVRVFKNDSGRWIQVGDDINGIMGDYSGWTVSLSDDGKIVAIGSPFSDGSNFSSDAGRVRIYKHDDTSDQWSQLGQDIDGTDAGDQCGRGVSLSNDGNTVAIGSWLNTNSSGKNAGHTRVYKYNDASGLWSQLGEDLNGESEYDFSGKSVSLSGDGKIVAIGASFNDVGNSDNVGHVRVYEYDDTSGKWSQVGFDIDGETAFDESGYSVSLSDDGYTVATSARYNADNGDKAGQVRVFKYDVVSGQWSKVGQNINGENAYDYFGEEVALSNDGSIVAIGSASGQNGNGLSTGYVGIYEYI